MLPKYFFGASSFSKSNRRAVKRIIAIFIILLGFSYECMYAQTYQGWFEYKPTYFLPRNYKIGVRVSYRTNLEKPRWRTFEFRLMPEKKLSKHIDLLASAQLLETLQNESLSTSEIRLTVGGRWHFLPGRRFKSGVMARVEFRNVYKKQPQEWTYTTRPRLQIFASMPINEKSMSHDHVFYATSFVEFFYQNEEDLQETYANRYWIRLGLGYKLNYSFQFELLYNRQDSKNTIDTSYEELNKENIFVLSVRHKLNKPKKKK